MWIDLGWVKLQEPIRTPKPNQLWLVRNPKWNWNTIKILVNDFYKTIPRNWINSSDIIFYFWTTKFSLFKHALLPRQQHHYYHSMHPPHWHHRISQNPYMFFYKEWNILKNPCHVFSGKNLNYQNTSDREPIDWDFQIKKTTSAYLIDRFHISLGRMRNFILASYYSSILGGTIRNSA